MIRFKDEPAAMQHSPRIPELAQRDRFVRRCVKEWRVLTLRDEESACVPSNRLPARTVQLFWSSAIEAKRWAKALTGDDGLQEIPLQVFAAEILPGLQSGKGIVGVDWVADPIEAEVEPADLLLRLKTEAVNTFLSVCGDKGEVFLVGAENGPQLQAVTRRGHEIQVVQVYPTRAEADRALRRLGGKRVIADPIKDFKESTLPWVIERGHMISLEPIPGAGTMDVRPGDLVTRLKPAAA